MAILRRLRLAIFLSLPILFWTSGACAENAQPPAAARPWWLGFGYTQGEALEGMRGPDLTIQHESAEGRRAWRIGVGLDQSSKRGNDTERDYYVAGSGVTTDGGDLRSSDGNYGITALRLSQQRAAQDVRFYWGLGPLIGWSRSHDHRSLTHSDYQADTLVASYTGTLDGVRSTLRAGLATAVGVHCRITEKIAATAEFDQALLYRQESVTGSVDFPGSYGYGNQRKIRTSGFEFLARTIRISLLVHP